MASSIHRNHLDCISMIWKKKKTPGDRVVDLTDVSILPGFQYVTQPIHIHSNQVSSIEEFIYTPQMKHLYDTNMLIHDFLNQHYLDTNRLVHLPDLDRRKTIKHHYHNNEITLIFLFRLLKYYKDTLLFSSHLVWRFQYQVVCLSSSSSNNEKQYTPTHLQHLVSQSTQHHIEDI
jgi:hypothetical protein